MSNGNNSERRPMIGASAPTPRLRSSREVAVDWLKIYSETYRQELTPIMVAAYLEALAGAKPETLHAAMLRCLKTYKFFPVPAEILEAARIEAEAHPPVLKLSEKNYVPMSNVDREAISGQLKELSEKLGMRKYEAPDPRKLKEREKVLRKQAKQILEGRGLV